MSTTLKIDVTKFNPSLFGEDEDESNAGVVSEVSISPNDETRDSESTKRLNLKDEPSDSANEATKRVNIKADPSDLVNDKSGVSDFQGRDFKWNKTYDSDENESSNMATPTHKYCRTLTSSESEKEEKTVDDTGSPEETYNQSGDDNDDDDDDEDDDEDEDEDEDMDSDVKKDSAVSSDNDDSDDEDNIPLQLRVQKQFGSNISNRPSKRKRNELSDELSKDPDLYGIRRSGRIKDNQIRQEKATRQLYDRDRGRRSSRQGRGPKSRNSWSTSDEESSDSSADRRARKKRKNTAKRKRKLTRPQRIAGSRACTAGKTYKEVSTSDFSGEEPGIDDITENSDDNSSQSQTDYSTYSSNRQKRKSNRDYSVASAYYKPSNKVHPLLQSGGRQTSHFGQSAFNKGSSQYSSAPTSFSRVRRLSFVGSQRSDDGGDDDGGEDSLRYGHSYSGNGYSSDVDIIDRVVDYRLGRKNAVGDATTIYLMRQRIDPNEGFNAEAEKEDAVPQYLIKWKDWSHLHNTWESMESLYKRQADGLKKVDKFNQKLKELSEWKMSATPEEIEDYNYQEEQNMHLYEQYRTVERVILHRNETKEEIEYYVKWMGLPYAESSWEAGWVIEDLFPQQVEDYRIRNKSTNLPTPRGAQTVIQMRVQKNRSIITSLKEQPNYIGSSELRLRDYQLFGIRVVLASFLRGKGIILADEMGLGKTIQTIGFLSVLYKELNIHGPYLLVVPLSTVASWQKEFALWAPFMNTICYLGDRLSREKIRSFEWFVPNNKRALRFNACITTYEILMADKSFLSQVHWAALMVDEAHRLKNDESILYQNLYSFNTYFRLLITGTPLQNSLRELWALLHFMMPTQFPDWLEFNDKYSIEKANDCVDLWKVLKPFILRRDKASVEHSLPGKIEKILRVELSRKQKQYYKWILTKNYDALSKGVKGSISGFVNIVMELKKLCNHPYLVRAEDDVVALNKKEKLANIIRDSGKMLLLDKLLDRLHEQGHRVLIFSQMVRMLDILEDYLRLKGWHFQRLDGSVRGDLRKTALDHFNAENSNDFVFLLSTRAGGLGINLATANTVIIFDSDWNPQNDLQAQARAHRIGQTKEVSVYRFVQTGSVEETIIERAKKKMVLDHLVIQRMDTTGRTVLNKKTADKSQPFNKDELNQILKFGAEDLFQEREGEETECPDFDIDDILNKAKDRDEEKKDSENSAAKLLSFFSAKVHNFAYDDLEEESNALGKQEISKSWDDIIPEEDIKLKREEENQAFLEQLNLGPRNRKQTKLFNYGQDENDDEDEDDDDDENEDGTKRGKLLKDKDLRALVRSMRRFPRPLDRVDAIITASERLQELSVTKVKMVIADILHKCNEAMEKWNDEEEQRKLESKDSPMDMKDDESSRQSGPLGDRKPKKIPAPTVDIGHNVTVNAKQIVHSIKDLEPLAKAMPKEHSERLKYKLPFTPKPVSQWKADWTTHDDAQLLVGVYEHGIDSWDSIKMDPELSLMDKILPPNGKHRPQATHLKTRVEYLIKLLRQYQEDPSSVTGVTGTSRKNAQNAEKKVPRKRPNTAPSVPPRKKPDIVIPSGKSREFIENSDISSLSSSSDSDVETSKRTNSSEQLSKGDKKDLNDGTEKKSENKKKRKREDNDTNDANSIANSQASNPKRMKKEPNAKKKKNYSGPMHFTTHEPVLVKEEKKPEHREGNEDDALSPERFKELKDVMRPVRKILKRLETCNLKDESRTLDFVLRLGNHIRDIYHQQTSVEEVRRWRNDLWQFVSLFVDCSKEELHNMYKRTFKEHKEKGGGETARRRHSRSSDDRKDTLHREGKTHNHRQDHSRDRDSTRDNEHKSLGKGDHYQSHQDQNHRYDSYDSSRYHSQFSSFSHNSSLNQDLQHHGRDTSDFYRNSSQRHQRPGDSYNRPPQHWSSGSDYSSYGGAYGSDAGRWRQSGGGGGSMSSGGHRGPPTDAYNSYRRPGHQGNQRSRWS